MPATGCPGCVAGSPRVPHQHSNAAGVAAIPNAMPSALPPLPEGWPGGIAAGSYWKSLDELLDDAGYPQPERPARVLLLVMLAFFVGAPLVIWAVFALLTKVAGVTW